jgi:O-antigen/teichoic acid export membrane protein
MSENSLNKDYRYKIATNFLRVPVSFAIQALFPRLLGPVAYGNFEFLSAFADKIINFLDNGASVGFFTKLSQNKDDRKLVRFFWMIILVIAIAYLVFVLSVFSFGISDAVWQGQRSEFIVWSVILGIFTLCSSVLLLMMDAYELTIHGERMRMIQLITSVFIFLCIFLCVGKISLRGFYLAQLFIILLLILGSGYVLKTSHYSIIPREKLSRGDSTHYARSFWAYSHPLIAYSLVAMIVGIGERWFLQKFGGATQQAYFGFSYKISAFVFLFTSAMMPLLMREFSKLFGKTNIEAIASLYAKNLKILFSLATFLAVLISFNSEFVTLILGGKNFNQAASVLSVMAFYPVHQTLGQINGTLFYSTHRTREYRNIGISLMPIGFTLCFFLIGPKKYFGMDLGAIGLAYYMLTTQLISVSVTLFFNCRYLKLSYWKIIFFQGLILSIFIGIGFLVKLVVARLDINLIYKTGIHIATTSTLIVLFVLMFPGIVGFRSRAALYAMLPFKKSK